MEDLNIEEYALVSGQGSWLEAWNDFRQMVRELPELYQESITSAADMACIFTGNC